MGEQIPVTQARAELAELVNRVAYAGERIELTRHGKLVAALVSAADYQRLQDTSQVRAIGFKPAADPADPGQPTALPVAAESRPPLAPTDPGFDPQA